MDNPTKIIVLAANPKNTVQLRLDEEVREITEGLQRSKNRDQFRLQPKWAVRLRDLRRALLDEEPHIVHFCGHGEEDGLVVENETGQPILLSQEALRGLFELFSDQVKCVLLNACYSQRQAEAISSHIQYVIGMNRGISERAAIEFSVGFYDALGAGKSIEEAFKFGRNAIQLYDLPENLTPVIIRNNSVQLKTISKESRSYIFRFRAECEADVDELRRILGSQVERITKVNTAPFPDTEVEILAQLSLEELRDAMRKVEDGHVMVQTVAPIDKYTGERDYNLF